MNGSCDSTHGTLVNCIDGTVQLSAIGFAAKMWNAEWVDVVTGVAPERTLSEANDRGEMDRIYHNIEASFRGQRTRRLAIAAHSGCDVDNISDGRKIEMLRQAVDRLRGRYSTADVAGIWIDNRGIPSLLTREKL